MLADQLVAAAPMAIGMRTVTKVARPSGTCARSRSTRRSSCGAVCEPDGEQFKAKFEVRAHGEIAVAGTAVLVPYKNLAKRAGITREGPDSPTPSS